jgi:hypothetical protein
MLKDTMKQFMGFLKKEKLQPRLLKLKRKAKRSMYKLDLKINNDDSVLYVALF